MVHGRKPTKAELRDLVEQATVDCFNESEQVTGLYTMIEEYLAVPFQTNVLGVLVTVVDASEGRPSTAEEFAHKDWRDWRVPVVRGRPWRSLALG